METVRQAGQQHVKERREKMKMRKDRSSVANEMKEKNKRKKKINSASSCRCPQEMSLVTHSHYRNSPEWSRDLLFLRFPNQKLDAPFIHQG